jgi:hypothetical protein
VLRETTSRGLCGLGCPSRTGTREEPGTLIQGAPVFPGSSRLGIEPKTPGWLVQDPTTSPSGDLIPTIRGSGAHPGRGSGTRGEHGTLIQGAPVFPGSSRLGIEPKTPGWLVQDPTTSPSGDLIPTIRGSGAHPGRGSGTRGEHGTLIQGAPVFPGSSRLGIEPKTPGWLVQDPTTRPIGDLIPTIGGSGAHPGRGKSSFFFS